MPREGACGTVCVCEKRDICTVGPGSKDACGEKRNRMPHTRTLFIKEARVLAFFREFRYNKRRNRGYAAMREHLTGAGGVREQKQPEERKNGKW